VIPLYQSGSGDGAEILALGRVPALHHDDLTVWESLAICEYLAETFPNFALWPSDQGARARARAVSAEMQSSFRALREHMPMNVRSSFPGRGVTPEVQADINRIMSIWRDCRTRYGDGNGEFLFGPFTIADAMFAPVVTRFSHVQDRPRARGRGLLRHDHGAAGDTGMDRRREERADDRRGVRILKNASFEKRRWAFLRMTFFLNGIISLRHPEEAQSAVSKDAWR